MQVREAKAGHRIPNVVVVVDHLGTAVWEVITTA
jgi:hypothetical protein